MKVQNGALLVCLFFFTGFQRGQTESTDVLTEFAITEGAWIEQQHYKVYNVHTTRECAIKCNEMRSFTCRSFLYMNHKCAILYSNSKTHRVQEKAGVFLYEKKVHLMDCVNGIGTDYRGTKSTTKSGRKCQRWKGISPHFTRITPMTHPEAGLKYNYCRNPNGNKQGPWCYTTDNSVEICDIQQCTEDCMHCNGENYRGKIFYTVFDYMCQRWDSQIPHSHSYSPSKHPELYLEENYCRYSEGELYPWCYTTSPTIRWAYCTIPRCTTESPTIVPELTCATGSGSSYRGNISVTESGKTCQNWASQSPHTHSKTPENYPCSDLEGNYCRNPGYERSPWCYTTDPETRWEYCNVPSCEDQPRPDEPIITESKECYEGDGIWYRGDVSETISGKQCQFWTSREPHVPLYTPEDFPELDLRRNLCRNTFEGEDPWCYTTDPSVRWEYCNIKWCNSKPTISTPQFPTDSSEDAEREDCIQCNGEMYRGKKFTTINGYICQRWDSQMPHRHSYSPSNHPELYLEENYCRSSEGEFIPWCYTTSPIMRWDYCSIPLCLASEAPTIVPEHTCVTGRGSTYRGNISVTVSGKTCQNWTSQTPHTHNKIPVNYPCTNFEGNYCRNPDYERSPWCYTTDPDTRWEYCNVTSCGDQPGPDEPVIPKGKNCYEGDGSSYRGDISETISGKQCQFWTSTEPHEHINTPKAFPEADLRRNLCRNPNGEQAPWCYTTDPSVRWEYCKIERCDSKPSIFTDCKVGNGADYRGPTSTTIMGVTCQAWSSMTPHRHASFTPETHPDKGLESNQCRNPNNDENGPWCFTTDPNQRWNYCQIPDCEAHKCGEPAIKPKLCLGGKDQGCISKPHSWPWQISVRSSSDKQHFCGGTLIDAQWVLTSVHCISLLHFTYSSDAFIQSIINGESYDWSQIQSSIKIFLGIHTQHANGPFKQELNVSKVIMVSGGADIALVKLDRPAVINDKVSPACLPEKDDFVPSSSDCYVTGWKNSHGTGEFDLKQTSIQVIENKVCNLQLYLDGRVKDYEMCAGIRDGGTYSCQGENGGPLVCKTQNRFVLQGVKSWDFGITTKPGLYTRVSKFVKWIEQSMKEN